MHNTTPPIPPSSAAPPVFDKLSFLRYMKNIGRSYRKRAVELVSICRVFKQAEDQTPESYYDLRSAFQLVDDALMSATKAEKKTTEEADTAFEHAVSRLGYYEGKYKSTRTVVKRFKTAEEEDKSSLKVLNGLMKNFRPPKEEPTSPVQFLLHESPSDNKPTVVTQELCESSHLNEILWNFGRFENGKGRLTLKQNPHFYNVLPTSPEKYGDKFLMEPIEKYLQKKISVLTDNFGQAGRVFLKTDKFRAFGNVWIPKDTIIFKDVSGKLVGESFVDAVIQNTPNLRYFTEPPPSFTSPSSPLSNRITSPSTTETSMTSLTESLSTDWRKLIRQMLLSSDVNILISTKPPIKSIYSPTAPSSPFSLSGFNRSFGSLSPTDTPQSRSSTPELPPEELSPKSPELPSTGPIACPSPGSTTRPSPGSTALPSSESTAHPSPESTASPSPGATVRPSPGPTALPSPDPHSKLPSQFKALPAPQPRNGGVPLSGHSVTTSQERVINTVAPHAESREAEVTRHVPSQRPGPSHQHEVTPSQLPQLHVQINVPTLQDSTSRQTGRKRNWFQKHVYDYGK